MARYGIGEWFGYLYRTTTSTRRAELVEAGLNKQVCPFRASYPFTAPERRNTPNTNCTKSGGVCSIRTVPNNDEEDSPFYGPLVTTCPARFVEDGLIFQEIAENVLNAENFTVVKELPFLETQLGPPRFLREYECPPRGAEATEEEGLDSQSEGSESVGRIDMVLVNDDEPDQWCAVELQAVYFSGASMTPEFRAIREHATQYPNYNGPAPGPVGLRRPDFRSSGPKRLLPQLQIKVPSLRRWGKKMVVVVDVSFFNTFGPMQKTDHVSNADIVWCVVGYEENATKERSKLSVRGLFYATLEESIIGLTAGKPKSLPEFERKLGEKVTTAQRKRLRIKANRDES